MASAIENSMAIWTWPMTMAKFLSDCAETWTSAGQVIDARLPMITAAATNPFTADHRELALMVSEKVDAFGRSQRTLSDAQATIRRNSEANARALGRLAGGAFLGPSEWTRIFERNLETAATLATLPSVALAPVHTRATGNAKRLARY